VPAPLMLDAAVRQTVFDRVKAYHSYARIGRDLGIPRLTVWGIWLQCGEEYRHKHGFYPAGDYKRVPLTSASEGTPVGRRR
jgi:hypothetical protein